MKSEKRRFQRTGGKGMILEDASGTRSLYLPLLSAREHGYVALWDEPTAVDRLRIRRLSFLSLPEAVAMFESREGAGGHSHSVAALARLAAEAAGEDGRDILRAIESGALLHDIGKLGIPPLILDKPGTLTAVEMEIMREHPLLGFGMLAKSGECRDVARIVLHHHERFDGRGYPQGLSGENIPLGARILALADMFDAATSDRPYRPASTFEDAFLEIDKGSGRQFDPRLAGAFLNIPIEALRRAKNGGEGRLSATQ